jgi:hypothetical protein
MDHTEAVMECHRRAKQPEPFATAAAALPVNAPIAILLILVVLVT